MFSYKTTVKLTLFQYAILLLLYIAYAFFCVGRGQGIAVSICSLLCFGTAIGVVCFAANETAVVMYLFSTVLIASWYIGTILHTMNYAFIIFLAAGLLVATFISYIRNVIFMLFSDIVLILSALFQWESYGENSSIFLYIILFLCYNMANITICLLVYQLQKHVEMLQEKALEAIIASESKGSFLANMSHEIRTPMNAISGLNQLILQEDIKDTVREKAFGIQTACSDLLTIVNDILDFSKIESGKMEIVEAEYKLKELIQDIVNLVCLRIEERNVEMLVDCEPDLPARLYGDDIRVKQVIMNLLTNAVKFTEEGYVRLSVSWEEEVASEGVLKVSVEDTGIGIRQDSLQRMFESFEQVDTKRNRKEEGTGLGLAILKQLVDLMGGKVEVESEYGKGSVFTVYLPQKRVGSELLVHVEAEGCRVLIYTFSDVFKEMSAKMFRDIAIPLVFTTSFLTVQKYVKEEEITDYFVADVCYREHPEFFQALAKQQNMHILQDRSSNLVVPDDIKVLYRPFYLIPLGAVINGTSSYGVFSKEDVWDFEYTAPKARVLVVDDNNVNLRVTVGLLTAVNMQIQTAGSGSEAIGWMKEQHFDLIFMDHMMPGMDGLEATRIIREMSEKKWDYFDTVPIVALTANAVGGAKEMFLSNGFNDFLAKPIELRELDRILRKWLPQEYLEKKQIPMQGARERQELEYVADVKQSGKSWMLSEEHILGEKGWPADIRGIDIEVAKHFLGNDAALFRQLLNDYFYSGQIKKEVVQQAYEKKDFDSYALETHSLKSSSKYIGAMVLAEEALELELAAKRREEDIIVQKHARFYGDWLFLLESLRPYVDIRAKEDVEEERKPLMRIKELKKRLAVLKKLMERMAGWDDMQRDSGARQRLGEDVLEKLESLIEFRYSREAIKRQIQDIKTVFESGEVERALELLDDCEKQL